MNNRLKKDRSKHLPIIGWREWVSLPQLGVSKIKAKVDSGARSSSLHATDVEEFSNEGVAFVRFKLHLKQRKPEFFIQTQAKVIDFRQVKSSSGEKTLRPVIMTNVQLLDQVWAVELTLANRNEMGFRMLLGREAFRGKFIVDAGNSFYAGKPRSGVVEKRKDQPSKDLP